MIIFKWVVKWLNCWSRTIDTLHLSTYSSNGFKCFNFVSKFGNRMNVEHGHDYATYIYLVIVKFPRCSHCGITVAIFAYQLRIEASMRPKQLMQTRQTLKTLVTSKSCYHVWKPVMNEPTLSSIPDPTNQILIL